MENGGEIGKLIQGGIGCRLKYEEKFRSGGGAATPQGRKLGWEGDGGG